MNILIIGCGYVGKALIPILLAMSTNVSVTTRKVSREPELSQLVSTVHVINGSDDLSEIIPDYDVVIFTVGADSRGDYETAYLANAKAIVAGLKRSDKSQRLIYTSTTSVYGDHGGDWVDETSELKPMTKQAEILVQTEEVLLSASSPTKHVCIFRLGEIVGPGRSLEERVIRNAGATFPGDGMSYTNLSPLELIVDGISSAVANHLEGVYNLCADEHVRRKDLYDTICRERNLPPINWDSSVTSIHGGNKRVSSKKYKDISVLSKF